jgi:hypothetical protein
LRFGVKVHESYHRLKSGLPSKIIKSPEVISKKTIQEIKEKNFKGTLFQFPDGINIIRLEGKNGDKLVIETAGNYSYYEMEPQE